MCQTNTDTHTHTYAYISKIHYTHANPERTTAPRFPISRSLQLRHGFRKLGNTPKILGLKRQVIAHSSFASYVFGSKRKPLGTTGIGLVFLSPILFFGVLFFDPNENNCFDGDWYGIILSLLENPLDEESLGRAKTSLTTALKQRGFLEDNGEPEARRIPVQDVQVHASIHAFVSWDCLTSKTNIGLLASVLAS